MDYKRSGRCSSRVRDGVRLIARFTGDLLPRYIIERSIGRVTRDDIFDAGRTSTVVLAAMPDVRWIRSYVSEVDGKMYCEYDAPSVDAILEHARRAGLPVDRISEIAMEINAAMFL
jgi:hypothetical protein